MRNMQFRVLFAASTILSVLSLSTPFIWRGNALRLKKEPLSKDDQFVVPFKLDNSEVIQEDVGLTDGKEGFPLLPEARPSYPGHRQLVFSNEMKFRELMSDCQSVYSNELIRCYVDQSGGIERMGLLCQIVESKSLKNGQAMYIIESKRKIMIDNMNMKPGKSYLTSSCTNEVDDSLYRYVHKQIYKCIDMHLYEYRDTSIYNVCMRTFLV
mmetsp:Transcript_22409/g.21643  ORF Transcript_22409/g.21643 Transcript_22409/m.21643 type:complete len:211 (+) Transcript_22409:141-773(+)